MLDLFDSEVGDGVWYTVQVLLHWVHKALHFGQVHHPHGRISALSPMLWIKQPGWMCPTHSPIASLPPQVVETFIEYEVLGMEYAGKSNLRNQSR